MLLGPSWREARADDETPPGTELGLALERDTMLALPAPPLYAPSLELAWMLGGLSVFPGQLVLVDGFSLTDPLTGTTDFALPASVLSHVEVLEAGLPASLGPTDAGALRLSLPRGLDTWRVDAALQTMLAETRYRDPAAVGLVNEQGMPTDRTSLFAGHASAAGPLVPGRVWASAAVALLRAGHAQHAEDPFTPAVDETELPAYGLWRLAYLAEVVARPVDGHELVAIALGRPAWAENIVQSPATSPEAEQDAFSEGWLVGASWQARWIPGLIHETRASFSEHTLEVGPHSGCTALDDPACSSHYDEDRSLQILNADESKRQRGRRLAVESSLSGFVPVGNLDQVLRGGLQFSRTWAGFEESLPGGAVFIDRSGRPYRVERMVPGPDGEVRAARDELTQDALGVHLADEFAFGGLRVVAGLRADLAWIHRSGQAGELRFVDVWPRLAAAWDPLGDGSVILRLGYSRQVGDPGMFALGALAAPTLAVDVFAYNPATADYDIFVGRSGEGEAPRVDSQGLVLVPVDTTHAGYAQETPWGLGLSFDLTWRRGSASENVPPSASDPGTGGEFSVVWNDVAFRGMVRTRRSERWQALVAYTYCWFDLETNAPEGILGLRDTHESAEGHRISGFVTYRAPWGLSGAIGLHWMQGPALSGEGGLGGALLGYPQYLLGWVAYEGDLVRLDLRMAWSLEELTGARVELTADLITWGDPDGWLGTDVWLALGLRYIL